MLHEKIEQIVRAVAEEYEILAWQTMFRMSEALVGKAESRRRKDAVLTCIELLRDNTTLREQECFEVMGWHNTGGAGNLRAWRHKNNVGKQYQEKYFRIREKIRNMDKHVHA